TFPTAEGLYNLVIVVFQQAPEKLLYLGFIINSQYFMLINNYSIDIASFGKEESSAGTSMMNSAPPVTLFLSFIRPLWTSTKPLTIDSPRPVPPPREFRRR